MKILIAIASCAEHLNRNTAVLETWASRDYFWQGDAFERRFNGVFIKLFTGRDLGVSDDYKALPQKVKAICEYADVHEFDFLWKGDSDTFVWLDRLLTSGFERHDYCGWTGGVVEPSKEYASGGAGYWLSRKAFEIVANAQLTDDTCEDRWVGRVLYDAGIIVHRDTRYGTPQLFDTRPGNAFTDKTLLTYHPVSPKMMYELHRASH